MVGSVSVVCSAGAMLGARDDGEGAARRRRERRLRSWLRHERQSVTMALSEYKHHSPRGRRKDRAGEEGHRDKDEAPRRQKPPPPQRSRPPCLGEPRGPQARVRCRAHGPDSGFSCASDGGTAGGRPPFLRYAVSCCRAGYRRAHDLSVHPALLAQSSVHRNWRNS